MVDDIVAALRAGIRTVPELGPNAEARAVSEARKRLVAVLTSPAFTVVRDRILGTDTDPGVAGWMIKREFDVAAGHLSAIEKATVTPGATVTQTLLTRAVSTKPVRYMVFRPVGPRPRPGDDDGGNRDPEEILVPQTLPGYTGPRLNASHLIALPLFCQLVAGGPERDVRLALLQGDCLMGTGDHDGAIRRYDRVLSTKVGSAVQRQLVALRAAQAHLARGDLTYRKSRALTRPTRDKAKADYDAAVTLLARHDVHAGDPLRKQVQAHADLQRAKLDSRLNHLGLRDSFVPPQRYTKLERLADGHIDTAISSAEDFERTLASAQDAMGKRMDLKAEISAEAITNQISQEQVDNATLSIEKVEEQIELIEDQQTFLPFQAGAAALGSIAQGVAAGMTGGGTLLIGAGVGGAGLTGNVVNWLAQDNELGHQLAMAELEKEIAINQADMAALHKQLSDNRLAYLRTKEGFLGTQKLMNADALYALAEVREKRAERRLEAAIFMAYLYERALAFFFGKPDTRIIDFDYVDRHRDRAAGVVQAAKDLQDDFDQLIRTLEADTESDPFRAFEQAVSLREEYPLQFHRFLQTGDMHFVYSLYQLSKIRPATQHCRLYEVGVEVKGLIPALGYRGTLTHTGRFAVRDRQATLALDPATARLIPTEEQVQQALQTQREQGSAAAAVGGVLYYGLLGDEDSGNTLDLSEDTQFVSDPPENPTLGAFEGLAPTGAWHLRIEDHEQLDITDVVLHFGIVNRESDEQNLAPLVREMVRRYEAELADGAQLDKIAAISLRQDRPDTFFDLESGQTELVLDEADVAPDLTNLRFNWAVLQAVDEDGRGLDGIHLTLDRSEHGYRRDRLSGTDGFTEDLDADPDILPEDQRFPLLGTWRIGLPETGQFARLGDVRVFLQFTYEQE